jgi:DNA processing protein
MLFSLKRTKSPADLVAALRLIRTAGIGPVHYRRLFQRFDGDMAAALGALPDLMTKGGKAAPAIPTAAAIEDELAALHKQHGRILLWGTTDYPQTLGFLPDAPPALAVIGDPAWLHKPCVGIVGARNASQAGKRWAEITARALGQQGYVVASGLARGVDTAAHQGSLETGTIAVLAGGVDHVYPPENKKLYDAIAARGCLVSDQPFGTAPSSTLFPRRNRIIAGLSYGVVLVEAAAKSGSLITAHYALDYGREVFAVPHHPMDPRGEGPNGLIKRQMATLATEASDIVDALAAMTHDRLQQGLVDKQQQDSLPLLAPSPAAAGTAPTHHQDEAADDAENPSTDQEKLLECLSKVPIDINALTQSLGWPVEKVLTNLLELELIGRIERHAGHRVSLL